MKINKIWELMTFRNSILGGAGGGGGSGAPAGGAGGAGGAPASGTDWRATIPEEYRNSPVLQQVPDLPTLVKNYVNAEKLIGAKRIAIPGQNATPDQWNEVWTALGRPESHDKYSPATVKPADGVNLSNEALAKARETFHKLGLNDSQAKGLMDFYVSGLNETHGRISSSAATSQAQASESLRREWGDKFDVNLGVAREALRKFGDEAAIQELESGLGNNVGLIKMLHKIGAATLEGRQRTGELSGGPIGQARALQEIETLKGDPNFMKSFMSATDPGHKSAVERWMALHREAAPGTVS